MWEIYHIHYCIIIYGPQGCIYLIKKYSKTSNIVKYYYILKKIVLL